MVIDLGEAEILEGEVLEAVDGAVRRKGAKAHEVEEFVEFAFFHGWVMENTRFEIRAKGWFEPT